MTTKIIDSQYLQMANCIRVLTMDAVERASSGHPGMPMGMADVATILFAEFLNFNPKQPKWPNRDRFILSAGHGSMLLYALLYLTGYEDIDIEDIKNFRQLHSKTPGHPEYGVLAGIETTTGPLGQGLANAVGMSIAEKILGERYHNQLIDHYTYVMVGDGCLMEGISQEAISIAGHLNLNKLIILFDDNNISIDGPVSLTISDDYQQRFLACNFHVQTIDGHNFQEIRQALSNAKASDKPSIIFCKTIIAKGAVSKLGSEKAHGAPLGAEEISKTRNNIMWDYPPFEIPENLLALWRSIYVDNNYSNWCNILSNLSEEERVEFHRIYNGILPNNLTDHLARLKQKIFLDKPNEATRKSSGAVIESLKAIMPELIGGSADLTGSNNTKANNDRVINKDNFSGNYIHYGVREHAMAAIMNGMALHGGIIPYAGTFLVFSDYFKPAIRLAALMKQKLIYVLTHDSIGVGEDGPTHQPIEHLISLRSIPDLYVYRPADAIETIECWELALTKQYPAAIVLTRQNLPLLRTQDNKENLSAQGAYIISEFNKELEVTIFASGSEVQIAIKAQQLLEQQNIGTRVVSVPSMEVFAEQSEEYKSLILNNSSLKVAIEAALKFGWERYIGDKGIFIGMQGFGASGAIQDLYQYFNITAEHAVNKILARRK